MSAKIRHIADRNTLVLAVRTGSRFPALCGKSIARKITDFPLDHSLPVCESCRSAAGDSSVLGALTQDDFEWRTENPSQGVYTYEFLGSVTTWGYAEGGA